MLIKHRRNRGFSLIEIMVAVSILGIISAMVAAFMGNMADTKRLMRKRAVRDSIKARLAAISSSPQAILNSIGDVNNPNPGNKQLLNCVTSMPGSGTDCKNIAITYNGDGTLNTNNAIEFDLYTNTSATSRVAGRNPIVVRYGRDGSLGRYTANNGTVTNCDTSSAKCPFSARAFFWPTCPGGIAQCVTAETIHVATQLGVRQLTKAGKAKGQKGDEVTNVVTVAAKTATTFAEPISVWEIMKEEPNQCGDPNALVTRRFKNPSTGQISITCACQVGYTSSVAAISGGVRCTKIPGSDCLPDEDLIGVSQGISPLCQKPELNCRQQKFAGTVDCGTKAWMYTLQLEECKFSKTGKDPKPFVDCKTDDNSTVCCEFK